MEHETLLKAIDKELRQNIIVTGEITLYGDYWIEDIHEDLYIYSCLSYNADGLNNDNIDLKLSFQEHRYTYPKGVYDFIAVLSRYNEGNSEEWFKVEDIKLKKMKNEKS